MADWSIKRISEMTNISIRMLRHYDKLGLLHPSYRSSNGYRRYNEEDLAKLQQIIALRYFGFNLSAIKNILQKSSNIYAHLHAQSQVLKRQVASLQHVSNVLGDILETLSPSKPPEWSELITLIERYQMNQNVREKLKDKWAGLALTEEQFEEYLFIYEQFPEEFTTRDKIIEKINNEQYGDPEGPDGREVAGFMHELAKKTRALYSHQVKLGSSLLESLKSGKLSSFEVTPKGTLWLARATLSYWLTRWDDIYEEIVSNLQLDPEGTKGKEIACKWTGLIEDFIVGCKPMMIGFMIWQELARQAHELKGLETMQSPQEMLKNFHVKLMFNPEAASWICRALEVHAH